MNAILYIVPHNQFPSIAKVNVLLDEMLCLDEHELQSILICQRWLKATGTGMLAIPFASSERLLKFNEGENEQKINVEQ